ncbi:DNA helicase [Clostridium sp. Cult2]|uniref:DNA helicase n=1 Tax=Clostridium sp. Cult2 TaxID=2079003 RepID=UPI001F40FB8B|nr:DNA helicase [Clostridium sp. Cult2]MCF6466338.1 DNA helicase [Clostridium sp. Cult2]
MIDEIKIIVRNYLNNIKLTRLILGTVVADGIKISDKLTVPLELIKGNMKKHISTGDKVRLIRNHGGQEYYIVEIIGKEFVAKGSTIKLSIDGVTRSYKVEDVIK